MQPPRPPPAVTVNGSGSPGADEEGHILGRLDTLLIDMRDMVSKVSVEQYDCPLSFPKLSTVLS